MKRIRIKFWGVRGSIPTPGCKTAKYGGNTPCIEIGVDGDIIICDAGTGIRPLGIDLIRRAKGRRINAAIILSHMHWDHYTGLPFFKPLYDKRNSFLIGGPKVSGKDFGAAMRSAFRPPYFPIPAHAIPARVRFKTIREKPLKIGGVLVRPIKVNHPGGALGWRFDFEEGRSIALITDNEPKGRKSTGKVMKLIETSKILIHDAQFMESEYKKRIGWGHSPIIYPLTLAAGAGVERLILFHHDPDSTDKRLEKMLEHAKAWIEKHGIKLQCELAREGLAVYV